MIPYTKEYRCKECNGLLVGHTGVAEVSRDYFSVKGQITLQKRDPVTGVRYFVYVSNDALEMMCFCDTNCFDKYCKFKEKMRNEERLKAKRAMNAKQWADGNGGFNSDQEYYGK